MLNRYAIIYPAFTFAGDGLADMPYLLITPLHKCLYEQICGYSLGHEPVFYDTLLEAQKNCTRQTAIVEFEVQEEKVTKLSKIFEIKKFEKLFEPVAEHKNNFFRPVNVPVWNEKKLSDGDLSAKALEEFNKYHEKNVLRKLGNR